MGTLTTSFSTYGWIRLMNTIIATVVKEPNTIVQTLVRDSPGIIQNGPKRMPLSSGSKAPVIRIKPASSAPIRAPSSRP